MFELSCFHWMLFVVTLFVAWIYLDNPIDFALYVVLIMVLMAIFSPRVDTITPNRSIYGDCVNVVPVGSEIPEENKDGF
jgi:hypothetical protein